MSKLKKIFWVEDEKAFINVYEKALEGIFDVEFISLARTALDRIKEIEKGKEEKPSLFVIDLLLPDMNGVIVLDEIKKIESLKDIPAFILTNYGEVKDREKFIDGLEVEKYLVKTKWPPSKLIPLIKETIELKS